MTGKEDNKMSGKSGKKCINKPTSVYNDPPSDHIISEARSIRSSDLSTSTADEKERAIVDAARAIFLSNGFEAASMDAIAQSAGVSKRTVYNRFSSKEALFAATIKETCQRLLPVDIPDLDDTFTARALIENIAYVVLRGILEPEAIALRRIATFEAYRKPALGIAFLEHGPDLLVETLSPMLTAIAERAGLTIDDSEKAIWRLAALLTEPLHTNVLLGRIPDDIDTAIDRQVKNAIDAFWKIYIPTHK